MSLRPLRPAVSFLQRPAEAPSFRGVSRRARALRGVALLLCGAPLAHVGCSSSEGSPAPGAVVSPDPADAGATTAPGPDASVASDGGWAAVDAAADGGFPAPFDTTGLASAAPYGHVLYLNFSGAALAWDPVSDAARNTSWIRKDRANSVIPAFFEDYALDVARPTRTDVVANLAARIAAAFAPFDVQVVTQRPAIDAFAMVVVGGRNVDLGRSLGSYGVGSPNGPLGACGFSPGATAFVTTSDWLGSAAVGDKLNTVASVVAHEAGHLFGLVHTATGGTMDAAGSLGWTSGPAVADVANVCGRTVQDDVAILSGNLGAHQTRPPVPFSSDQTPPQLSVIAPAAQVTTGSGVVSCVTVADASPIQYVMRQVLVKAPAGEYIAHQDVRFAAPYTFPPVDIGNGAIVRFLAADRWDNVAEKRVTFQITPGAPPPSACP